MRNVWSQSVRFKFCESWKLQQPLQVITKTNSRWSLLTIIHIFWKKLPRVWAIFITLSDFQQKVPLCLTVFWMWLWIRLDLFYCVKTTWLKSWKLSPAPNKFCVLQVTVIIMTDDSDPDSRLIKLVLMHSFLHREDWKRKFFLLLDFFILKTFYTNRKMGFVYLFWTFNVFIVLEKTKGLPRKLFTSNWNLKVSRWFVIIKKIAGLLSFSAPRR